VEHDGIVAADSPLFPQERGVLRAHLDLAATRRLGRNAVGVQAPADGRPTEADTLGNRRDRQPLITQPKDSLIGGASRFVGPMWPLLECGGLVCAAVPRGLRLVRLLRRCRVGRGSGAVPFAGRLPQRLPMVSEDPFQGIAGIA
jgi:hypothetical protein